MKILIGYDGSKYADAALDDLKTAGLPENDVEVTIMSIAEVWLPPVPADKSLDEYVQDLQTQPQPFKAYERGAKAVAEVQMFAKHAQNRLQQNFPKWQVNVEANYGSPAWEIIVRANKVKADLVIVGSQGRTALGRLFLGSISNKVLNEANCSVRIARGRVEVDPIPSRVIIGFDGSPGAMAAVETVASRNWREESVFKLVVATDLIVPTAIGRFVSPVTGWIDEEMKSENTMIEKLAEPALKILNDANCATTLQILSGNPKQVLIEEALRWHADSIFVGANRFDSRLERFLLGSVSAAVATRAHCSVEVVRHGNGETDSE